MSEEIKLKKTILDAVLSLLSGMEFSQEEGSIELEIMEAKKRIQDARAVYASWISDWGRIKHGSENQGGGKVLSLRAPGASQKDN